MGLRVRARGTARGTPLKGVALERALDGGRPWEDKYDGGRLWEAQMRGVAGQRHSCFRAAHKGGGGAAACAYCSHVRRSRAQLAPCCQLGVETGGVERGSSALPRARTVAARCRAQTAATRDERQEPRRARAAGCGRRGTMLAKAARSSPRSSAPLPSLSKLRKVRPMAAASCRVAGGGPSRSAAGPIAPLMIRRIVLCVIPIKFARHMMSRCAELCHQDLCIFEENVSRSTYHTPARPGGAMSSGAHAPRGAGRGGSRPGRRGWRRSAGPAAGS